MCNLNSTLFSERLVNYKQKYSCKYRLLSWLHEKINDHKTIMPCFAQLYLNLAALEQYLILVYLLQFLILSSNWSEVIVDLAVSLCALMSHNALHPVCSFSLWIHNLKIVSYHDIQWKWWLWDKMRFGFLLLVIKRTVSVTSECLIAWAELQNKYIVCLYLNR